MSGTLGGGIFLTHTVEFLKEFQQNNMQYRLGIALKVLVDNIR